MEDKSGGDGVLEGEVSSVAVALRYDGASVPVVVAKGQGEVARRIIELAEEHGVPLKDDPALVGLLSQVSLGDEIPESLFMAVAEILAFAYALHADEQ